ncbi:MAG TPA: polyhydroxyalkanoate synthesis regulator DNA-binding domain-containing protein [Candidatus Saccharimonadales bacterium]|nr:polyhydroxyalkanoate synthesis regulator DNA-binding domain-containing protein [Candidatus Saccharimonadales bacterium]
MERKKIVIKKYENRRLYDATHSRYVNLDEIARAIQDGNDVQVLDASSGEDITRLVLTLIIVEQAKEPNSVFPLDVLREMVVASGKATQESAMNYMSALTNMYRSVLPQMPQPAIAPLEFLQNMMQQASQRGHAPPPTPQPSAPAQEAPADPEVSNLKSRIDELEQLVKRMSPPPARKKAAKKSPKRVK